MIKARFSAGRFVLSALLLLSVALTATAGNSTLVSTRFGPGTSISDSAEGDSFTPVISPDGRYVLFASSAINLVKLTNQVSGVAPRRINVYLRDRTNQTIVLISVNATRSGGGNGDSLPAGISSNGRYALFESTAADLVANDTNNASDIFLRDVLGGTTTLISADDAGVCGSGDSRDAVMTPDALYVAFVSAATNLVAGDTNQINDIFVRDVAAGTNILVSAGARTTNSWSMTFIQGAYISSSESPEITPDGRYVAFYSTAIDLVSDVRRSGEVYVRDLVASTTTWASSNAWSVFQPIYGHTNVACCNQRISDNGRYVAFEVVSNSVPFATAQGIILRQDLQTGLADIVDTNVPVMLSTPYFENLRNLDMTPDGRYIAYVGGTNTGATICRWDANTSETLVVSTNWYCNWPVMDSSGRYLAYLNIITNSLTYPMVETPHLSLADLQNGTVQLLDLDTNGISTEVISSARPAMSADGQSVAFESSSDSLVARDDNRASDVFVRDWAPAGTELISTRSPGIIAASPNGPSGFSTVSASTDGRYVAFTSDASDLTPNDTNQYRDVFVRDLVAGTTTLVSVGTDGFAGNGLSTEPSISGDGRYVAFTSWATNLVTGDTNNAMDIFVRDLQAGTTMLVSRGWDGVSFGSGDSYSSTLSTDGRQVVFLSNAGNLIPNSSIGYSVPFLCDLEAGTNYALSSQGTYYPMSLTPDAALVAYFGSVYIGNGIVVWSLQTHSPVYTNLLLGMVGTPAFSLSPNGRWLVYSSNSTPALYGLDLPAQTSWQIASAYAKPGRFSADGRFLVYSTNVYPSNASTLPGFVHLHDMEARTNLALPFPCVNLDIPEISPDGRFIAYRFFASNSVATDSNDVPDIVLYDRVNDLTALISANTTFGRAGNGRSFAPQFTADSKTLLFRTWASDLISPTVVTRGGAVHAFPVDLFFPLDADVDGMNDQWELDHFGTLSRDGTGDFDGDGVSDRVEGRTGTDPTDPQSLFAVGVTPPDPAAGSTITWPTAPWKTYRVQYKNDLNETNWHELTGNAIPTGTNAWMLDTSPDPHMRFYRVMLND